MQFFILKGVDFIKHLKIMKIYESLFGYELKNSSFKVYNFLESTYYWTDIATVKLSTIAKRCNLSVNTAQRTTNQYKIKRLSGRFITIERDLLYHKNMDITSFVIFCAISMDKNNDKHAKSFTSISKLTKITGITRVITSYSIHYTKLYESITLNRV